MRLLVIYLLFLDLRLLFLQSCVKWSLLRVSTFVVDSLNVPDSRTVLSTHFCSDHCSNRSKVLKECINYGCGIISIWFDESLCWHLHLNTVEAISTNSGRRPIFWRDLSRTHPRTLTFHNPLHLISPTAIDAVTHPWWKMQRSLLIVKKSLRASRRLVTVRRLTILVSYCVSGSNNTTYNGCRTWEMWAGRSGKITLFSSRTVRFL